MIYNLTNSPNGLKYGEYYTNRGSIIDIPESASVVASCLPMKPESQVIKIFPKPYIHQIIEIKANRTVKYRTEQPGHWDDKCIENGKTA
jgi:hypothetical protein